MSTEVTLLKHLTWLGHASFRIDGPTTIYFDPWNLKGDQPPADIILVSHEHHDHCSPEDIERVRVGSTVIVADAASAKKLDGDVLVLQPGGSTKVGDVEIEAVPAYTVTSDFHPERERQLGYIVSIGGERIYHAGDTDRIPEMADFDCDIALLPVGGTYTMDAEQAAQAATDIGPMIAVPMHWGAGVVGELNDAERFRELYRGEVVILKPE